VCEKQGLSSGRKVMKPFGELNPRVWQGDCFMDIDQKRSEMFQNGKAGGLVLGTVKVHYPDDIAVHRLPMTPRSAAGASRALMPRRGKNGYNAQNPMTRAPDVHNYQDQSISALLAQLSGGKREVEERLIPLVYSELRRVVARLMRRERANHTLQPTALVNEAWLRLVEQPEVNWKNRAHFFGVASLVMRQILVDHARRRKADKRGGTQQQVTLEEPLIAAANNSVDVLALHELLERLNDFDPRASRVVEMHFFGGLSFEEMAEVLHVAVRTVKRDWHMARAWLRDELSRKP
jgi:RNA polymerase sigma factor (TIGR02999 family)